MNFFVVFPMICAGTWLIATTILAKLAGWFELMEAYPDQPDEPILRLRGQGGTMGYGIRMNGVLTLAVCPTGLRIAMNRLFGPFCRDFLVPWESIAVVRNANLFGKTVQLEFGNPIVGTLRIRSNIANRLANAAMERWPEKGPFAVQTRNDIARQYLMTWATVTSIGGLFFSTFFHFVASPGGPPIWFAFAFPGVFFGIILLARFLVVER